MIYLFILILVLLLGFVSAYQSESDSQDCTQFCTHWVHGNKSRWRHNILLSPDDTIHERIGLMYSVVEWRRSLIVTIIITVPLCLIMYYKYSKTGQAMLKLFVLSFVYVFIIVFFIAMYYQDLWHKAMAK